MHINVYKLYIIYIIMNVSTVQFRIMSISLWLKPRSEKTTVSGLKHLHLNNLKTQKYQDFFLNLNFQFFSAPSPTNLSNRR